MTRIYIFSSMTLHLAPGDGFLGTQRTVIWMFHSMNIHVVLSVVCGGIVFVISIPNINLITLNNMSMLHMMLPSQFLVRQVFFLINLTAINKMAISEVLPRLLLLPHMLCQPF